MLTLNWELIGNIVNVLILFVLLRIFLFKPVIKVIEKRREYIENQLADAKKVQADADRAKQQYSDILQKANAEADEILKKAETQAKAAYNAAMEQAECEAKKRVEQAEKEIAREREQMLLNVKDEAAEIALLAADKLVKKRIDSREEEKLLDEFIAEAGALR